MPANNDSCVFVQIFVISSLIYSTHWRKILREKFPHHVVERVDEIPWKAIIPCDSMIRQGIWGKDEINEGRHPETPFASYCWINFKKFVNMSLSSKPGKILEIGKYFNFLDHGMNESKTVALDWNWGNWLPRPLRDGWNNSSIDLELAPIGLSAPEEGPLLLE
ncbi:hypothetical protein Tco_0474038 [Tanacetum coccineum]